MLKCIYEQKRNRNELWKQYQKFKTKFGLTQKQLASKLGCCTNTIKNWEKARVETNAETLFRVATFFNVSADYLLGLEE